MAKHYSGTNLKFSIFSENAEKPTDNPIRFTYSSELVHMLPWPQVLWSLKPSSNYKA